MDGRRGVPWCADDRGLWERRGRGRPADGDPGAGARSTRLPSIRPMGAIMIGTGAAFYRVDGAGKAQALSPTMTAPQGKGPVKDLVIRFTGPTHARRLRACRGARPADQHRARELERSGQDVDAGLGHRRVRLPRARGPFRAAVRVPRGRLDPGQPGRRATFQAREAPSASPPLDIAVNPTDPAHSVVSNQSGTFTSTNEGRSLASARHHLEPAPGLDQHGQAVRHRPRRHRPPQHRRRPHVDGEGHARRRSEEVAAAPDGTLYAITAGGKVHRSPDGVRWQPVTQVT